MFGHLISFIKHPFIKKNEPMLHTIEWVFVLLAFFAVGLSVAYFQISTNFLKDWWQTFTLKQEAQQIPEGEKEFVGETVPEPVMDVSGWDTYRNQWYGFEIKHPDSWTEMRYKTATAKTDRYETVYRFRKAADGQNDPYVGFDVAVYSTKKVVNARNTNEVRRRENAPEDTNACQFSEEENILGEENNKFMKVSVNKNDACFEPVYFFSLTKDDYMYDIVPIAKENAEVPTDPQQDVSRNFPEYKEVVSSFKNIPISRPAPKPAAAAKPRPSAKRPVAAKVVGGKLVCAKKNDKPRKSKKNKPGHLDLECCLDPDERPNPWCTY